MIISTNAAEIAVTFRDCWAVIDTCLVNQMVYDPMAKTQIHATVPCPKTASKQRAGRAGRTVPGINIKLTTQQEWDNLPDAEPPQTSIGRSNSNLPSIDETLDNGGKKSGP